ncbi:hypothetical protein PHYSODRAFT_416774, partial [Phytophthora sojae]
QILRTRKKYRDCKAFMCLDDCIGIRDGFNLEVLVKSIPAPRSPGRPRKQPRMGQHDTTFTGHNAIPKLLTK